MRKDPAPVPGPSEQIRVTSSRSRGGETTNLTHPAPKPNSPRVDLPPGAHSAETGVFRETSGNRVIVLSYEVRWSVYLSPGRER